MGMKEGNIERRKNRKIGKGRGEDGKGMERKGIEEKSIV